MNNWIKIIIVPILSICLFVIVTMLYVQPGQAKIQDLKDQLDILYGKGDRMVPIELILKQEAIVDSLKFVVSDMKDRLYPVADFADLGQAIESSGRKFNLLLVTLTPDYSKLNLIQQEGIEITELPITINMQGQFLQFARYLERLSEFPYVKATEINLSRSEELLNSDNISIEIRGVVIFKSKSVINEPLTNRKPVSSQT
ncbi:hypothetical protein ACFL4L_05210 [bacterium]